MDALLHNTKFSLHKCVNPFKQHVSRCIWLNRQDGGTFNNYSAIRRRRHR